MAAPYTDRTYTPQQQGAKQIEWPLQAQGEYYARTIRRNMIALASEYAPIIGTNTSFTNSLTYSEVLTNGAWTNTALTVTDNQVANPADGQTTMSKFLETAANSEHRIAQAVTFTAVPWTVSCIVKGGLTRTNFYVRANDGTNSFSSFFDISAGTVGTQAANTVGAIRNLGGGYYQLLITFTPLAASGNVYFNVASSSSVISYAGTTSAGMYVWAAQAGAGSLLAPYIPTTNVARTVSSPYVDANAAGAIDDPFAYLCQESAPDSSGLGRGNALWQRVYARIPKQLVTYSTMAITKPSPPQQALGTVSFLKQASYDVIPTAIGSGTLYNSYLYSPDNTVYGALKTGTTPSQANVTSGLFRVKYKSSTTANLNYNDAGATVAAAINGLASVIADGLTVTVVNNFNFSNDLYITMTVGSTVSPFIIDANSFPSAASTLFHFQNSPTDQAFAVGYRTTIAAHGLSATDNLIVAQSNYATADTTVLILLPQNATLSGGSWAVVDANTVAFLSPGFTPSVYTVFGGYLRAYTPGPDRVGVKLIQDFYLPGITTGITTAADIPIPDPLINDTAFLAAAVANTTGYVTYDSDPLTFWLGPIYTQVKQQINMADV